MMKYKSVSNNMKYGNLEGNGCHSNVIVTLSMKKLRFSTNSCASLGSFTIFFKDNLHFRVKFISM